MNILALANRVLEDAAVQTSAAVGAGRGGKLSTLDTAEQFHQPIGSCDHRAASDYRALFDERAGIAEFEQKLSRDDAERIALDHCITVWMSHNPATSPDDHCCWCKGSDKPGNIISYGSGPHAWLHPKCWPSWHEARRDEATRVLVKMGVR
jgi:hypothetical protein